MFEDLFNYSKERQPTQALGFYIVFLIIGAVLGAVSGMIFASTYSEGLIVGRVVGVLYCTILSYLVLSAKGQLSTSFSAFIFITAILSYFLGALGGIISVAYLSTIKNLKSDIQNNL